MDPRSGGQAAYKNAGLPIATRVKDLLRRMTLEEKAAQMMCVWQKKPKPFWTRRAISIWQRPKPVSSRGMAWARSGRPSDAGGGKDAKAMAELTNAIQKFFHRAQPPGNPGDVSRGMSARSRRQRRHQLSPTHRPGGDVQSRAGRGALRHDGGGSARPRRRTRR